MATARQTIKQRPPRRANRTQRLTLGRALPCGGASTRARLTRHHPGSPWRPRAGRPYGRLCYSIACKVCIYHFLANACFDWIHAAPRAGGATRGGKGNHPSNKTKRGIPNQLPLTREARSAKTGRMWGAHTHFRGVAGYRGGRLSPRSAALASATYRGAERRPQAVGRSRRPQHGDV